jgi:DNA-binding Lrp family transcriptional regulator
MTKKITQEFYPITKKELEVLRDCDVLNTKTLVYLVLKLQNPYAQKDGHSVSLSIPQIAEEWNISESSVYRAIQALKKDGLVTVKKAEVQLTWNHDFIDREVKKNSTKPLLDKDITSRPLETYTESTKEEISSVFLTSDSTCSKVEEKPEPKLSQKELAQIVQSHIQQKIAEETSTEPRQGLTPLSQILAPTKINNPQQIMWQWLPDGEWKTDDGKLDPNFQEWLANEFIKNFGTENIHKAKADVLSYFRNDPCKLPIRWEQYHQEYLSKAQNIKLRIDHGCQISSEQQQQTIARLNAVRPVSSEQSVSAISSTPVQPPVRKMIEQSVENITAEIIEPKTSSPQIYAEDEYGSKMLVKTYTAEQVEASLPPENPIAKKMIAYFPYFMRGQLPPVSLDEQVDVINYAIEKQPDNLLFAKLAKALEAQGCTATLNDEGKIVHLTINNLVTV